MGRSKGFKREEVLDEATKLFWKKGYADTSLSDLEKATGVNKSGLYSEFKDKDDLYQECLKKYRDDNPVHALLRCEPLGWNNVEKMLKGNLTCSGAKGCLMALTARELAIVPGKVKGILEQNNDRITESLRLNIEAAKPKLAVDLLINMILTFTAGLAIRINQTKAEELLPEVDAFMQLLKKS